MSIPGLGQIPEQSSSSTTSTRRITLRPGSEYRFTAPPTLTSSSSTTQPFTIKLLLGTAEKDGLELSPQTSYAFSSIRSKITTWQGCDLEIDGRAEDETVKEVNHPTENGAGVVALNLHAKLEELRDTARRERREGPRVLITGLESCGRTTLARTLTSYATRMGSTPLVVNLDPKSGLLSLPGSLSGAVFATILDVEAADGWGSTPTSGPSDVPVKLPLVYYYGRKGWEEDEDAWRELVAKLAGSVSGRLDEDEGVKGAGVIVDGPGIGGDVEKGVETVAHAVDEFSVNIILSLGSPSLTQKLTTRFANEKTSLGEVIQVIPLEKSDGAVARDEVGAQNEREAAIKEYFFGGSRRTLSPQIQQVDFDSVVIWKMGDDPSRPLVKTSPSTLMEHWTLTVMNASVRDPPETIRSASVMGYVYVAEVDEERRKVRILAPVSGRLGDRPLVFGKWPEPFVNLLG